jgi:hypothetical protein
MVGRSTILITSTCWWAFPARLAMAFADLGYSVEAMCPDHHPLLHTSVVGALHKYTALNPLAALRRAIASSRPVLVVPCDDRAVTHLHQLHGWAAGVGHAPALANLIERSLGRIESFPIAERRQDLIDIARSEGIRAPEMMRVSNPEDLAAAIDQLGLPAIMKVDGTWGGLGVIVVRTRAEAEQALASLGRPVGGARALKRWIVDRDPYSLLPCLSGQRPVVNLQRFVCGSPANTAVACWNGEVLACIGVAALRTRGDRGNSTVVRVIDNKEMTDASTKLVRRLGLSGFCGFDFVLEGSTDAAHLVEMNPRATPVTHLPLDGGRNLIVALAAQLTGPMVSTAANTVSDDIIAFFPQAWHLEPHSPLLTNGYHDVPWGEPNLVRELLKSPWPERQWLARLLGRLRVSPSLNAAPAGATTFAVGASARADGAS